MLYNFLIFLLNFLNHYYMHTIYRVEASDGQGIFKSDLFYDGFNHYHRSEDDYPDIGQEYADDIIETAFWEGKYRSAVHKPCLLLYWFGPFLKDIISQGHSIFKIEVKACHVGPRDLQCIFKPEDIINKQLINF